LIICYLRCGSHVAKALAESTRGKDGSMSRPVAWSKTVTFFEDDWHDGGRRHGVAEFGDGNTEPLPRPV